MQYGGRQRHEEPMTQHQGRHFLQIPGPSPVPDRVLRAMDMPVIDHRSAQFAELAKTVFDGCLKIFKTTGPVIIFPCSGTGAWRRKGERWEPSEEVRFPDYDCGC